MRRTINFLALAGICATGLFLAGTPAVDAKPSETAVLTTYADIAQAGYEDSLIMARRLNQAVETLIATPTEANLRGARAVWIAAREPYQQTEGYRFGNPVVDDWEGRVNAWPLDEGLIDYVAASYGAASDANPNYTANVVANRTPRLGGGSIDATTITKELLSGTLHEADTVEANVATGYHAIEFLLWGQDLNGTGPGAGARPATDYDTKNCTGGNCARRAEYLRVATELLIDDLEEIVAAWGADGEARKALIDNPKQGVAAILTGLGSLSYGELAGERMKLGLMLHDPEEEHDCFADNTHNAHFHNHVGMMNIYTGKYARIDGTVVSGPGVGELVAAADETVHARIMAALEGTMRRMLVMKDLADRRVMAYDEMLAAGNDLGNKVVSDVIDGLVAQAKAIEAGVGALGFTGIEFEGSDSLDNPNAVFH